MDQSYFYWPHNPELITIGEFSLPFEVPIFGLILAVVLMVVGYNYFSKPAESSASKRKKRSKQAETPVQNDLPAIYFAGIFAGSLILGLAIFSILPSPGFQSIGPIIMHWYGFLFAMAFVIGYYIGSLTFKHAGKPKDYADSLLTYLFLGTLIGARMGEVIFYDLERYLRNPVEIFMIWQGGLASHGAFLGNIIAIWLYVRKRSDLTYVWVLDRMTLPFAFGGILVRTGNFFNHEIYGHPTEMPWGVIFERIGDGVPRHPSMLYEAAMLAVLFAVLWGFYKWYKNRPPEGAMLGLFLVILFTGRFFAEITKVEQADFAVDWIVGMGQLLSIPLVIVGLWILFSYVKWYKPEAVQKVEEKKGSSSG